MVDYTTEDLKRFAEFYNRDESLDSINESFLKPSNDAEIAFNLFIEKIKKRFKKANKELDIKDSIREAEWKEENKKKKKAAKGKMYSVEMFMPLGYVGDQIETKVRAKGDKYFELVHKPKFKIKGSPEEQAEEWYQESVASVIDNYESIKSSKNAWKRLYGITEKYGVYNLNKKKVT